ncbi:MAG: hypothetical protein LBU13_08700 [Synergistaceae bacterium]|jgi:hypothetical protein|nr:hypothetical protein [Synergistaceae bacterium]
MPAAFEPGDILGAVFSGRVDGQIKVRPVLYWMRHKKNTKLILVSGTFGTVTGREWELKLFPKPDNGLTKECVLRLDDTVYIGEDAIIRILGRLNVFELVEAKNMLIQYSSHIKENSPQDFDDDIFSVF